MSEKNHITSPPLCNRVVVKEIKPQFDCGPLRAFVTVYLPDYDFLIRFVRVVQQENMKAYASLPQTEFYTKTGEKRYYTVLTLPDELKQEICSVALAAWEAQK
jgi:hypothetical protein